MFFGYLICEVGPRGRMKLKTKNCLDELTIKGLDIPNRTIEGYGSVFDNKDSDGDVIVKGAYKKTIQESGPSAKDRIAHLYQHDMRQPLGKFTELYEDDKGLVFVSKMPDTALANDVLKLYDAKILKEHSVGFQIVKGKSLESHYEISEIKLYEISTVTMAANELAGMKSMDKVELLQHVNAEMKAISEAIKKGTFTDATFELLATKLEDYTEQYNAIIDSLSSKQEPGISTPESTEPDDKTKQIQKLIDVATVMAISPNYY